MKIAVNDKIHASPYLINRGGAARPTGKTTNRKQELAPAEGTIGSYKGQKLGAPRSASGLSRRTQRLDSLIPPGQARSGDPCLLSRNF